MKIEMSESLVASWLKHVKHCIVVNTNWKASPYWTPAVSDEIIGRICDAALEYFNAHQLLILESPSDSEMVDANDTFENDDVASATDWQSMLLQAECDAVGLAYSEHLGGMTVYAVESAFHRNNVQYSKQKRSWRPLRLSGGRITAWNVALKMFKNALSMYRWYGSLNAHIVFVAPMSSEPVEAEILNACNHVKRFYQEQGFHFDFEFYFKHAAEGATGSFDECIKAPVNVAATVVDDTSELYLRGHILANGTQSIDVLMLDMARRLLGCENLDEMAGMHLSSSVEIIAAIEQIRNRIVTVGEDNRQAYNRQKSRFDRCHGALRAYYAALHNLIEVPTLPSLRRGIQIQHGNVDSVRSEHDNGAVARGQTGVQIVLEPTDAEMFKQQLLQTHLARRTRVYADGRPPRIDEWRADSFTGNSNLMGNIKSSAAYRNATTDGVVRLEFSIVN